jgi:hypothetical protein
MSSHTKSGRYRSPSMVHARNVLLGRAVAARTFGGLGSFLAVIFLGTGIYLLQESFTDPLQAQAVGLIAGAFIIALATILIYFIFTPRKRFETDQIRRTRPPRALFGGEYATAGTAERKRQKPGKHYRTVPDRTG